MYSVLLLFSSYAKATLVQILHTNDTHSFLEHSTHNKNIGGAARIKSLIDFYKNKMKSEGIETLTFDAGDFTEGNIYFMADAAKKSFMAHNNMGYHAVTLGNHEYLMGKYDFNRILGEIDFNFSLLAANVSIYSSCENVRNVLKPYKEIKISGIKFGIFGVTSDEIFYTWRFECGKITNPIKAALYYEDILRKRKNDVVIGLTHLGLPLDIKLGRRSKETDLIIGGHSHSKLFSPVYVNNLYGKAIPIVQTGFHTNYLGRLLVEVKKNKPLEIKSYELIPAASETQDETMKQLVDEANRDLEDMYGVGWLDQILGKSDLRRGDEEGEKKWAYYVADTIKEKVGADIGIHTPRMNSEAYPIGDITRKSLINSIPRVFDLHEKYGWSIYTTQIRGVWLQLALDSLIRLKQPIVFSGISVEYRRGPFGIKLGRIIVNGKRINPFKSYRVALTEGVVRGAIGISKYSSVILRFPKKSPFKIWTALEERLLSAGENLTIDKVQYENHTFIPASDEKI